GKPPCVVLSVLILVNQTAQPGVPGAPLPTCGWSCGHVTEPLQLRQCPGATGRHVWVRPLRQTPCAADEVCQAGLPRLHPVLVHLSLSRFKLTIPPMPSDIRIRGIYAESHINSVLQGFTV